MFACVKEVKAKRVKFGNDETILYRDEFFGSTNFFAFPLIYRFHLLSFLARARARGVSLEEL